VDIVLGVIFDGLSDNFQPHSAGGLERSLRALKLVTRLRTAAVATKSYKLFETIMSQAEQEDNTSQAKQKKNISQAEQEKNMSQAKQEKNMEAARLALEAAYRPGPTCAMAVGDLNLIADFLRYHSAPHISEEDRRHVASLTIRAINPALNDPMPRFGTRRREGADELLAEPQEEIEKAKEGAAVAVTLEEVHDKLSALIERRKAVRDETLGHSGDIHLGFPLQSNSPALHSAPTSSAYHTTN